MMGSLAGSGARGTFLLGGAGELKLRDNSSQRDVKDAEGLRYWLIWEDEVGEGGWERSLGAQATWGWAKPVDKQETQGWEKQGIYLLKHFQTVHVISRGHIIHIHSDGGFLHALEFHKHSLSDARCNAPGQAQAQAQAPGRCLFPSSLQAQAHLSRQTNLHSLRWALSNLPCSLLGWAG